MKRAKSAQPVAAGDQANVLLACVGDWHSDLAVHACGVVAYFDDEELLHVCIPLFPGAGVVCIPYEADDHTLLIEWTWEAIKFAPTRQQYEDKNAPYGPHGAQFFARCRAPPTGLPESKLRLLLRIPGDYYLTKNDNVPWELDNTARYLCSTFQTSKKVKETRPQGGFSARDLAKLKKRHRPEEAKEGSSDSPLAPPAPSPYKPKS